ncbi:hypothetical protein ACFY4I_30965 [Streptomyces scabiei]|uniref:hypothetical protein n=1 Tax=Streptomyces scabiei TaxID=1930 RepID=UPI00369B5C32
MPHAHYRVASQALVSADGRGVFSHARCRLLADIADVTRLTTAFTSLSELMANPVTDWATLGVIATAMRPASLTDR